MFFLFSYMEYWLYALSSTGTVLNNNNPNMVKRKAVIILTLHAVNISGFLSSLIKTQTPQAKKKDRNNEKIHGEIIIAAAVTEEIAARTAVIVSAISLILMCVGFCSGACPVDAGSTGDVSSFIK